MKERACVCVSVGVHGGTTCSQTLLCCSYSSPSTAEDAPSSSVAAAASLSSSLQSATKDRAVGRVAIGTWVRWWCVHTWVSKSTVQ